MSGKNKRQRIRDIARFSNVFEYTDFDENSLPKGNWKSGIFKNQKPITLELACGKGEYTVNLARKYPDRNFIGIDIKGPRIWLGAKTALEESLENVRFIRMFIDHLENYFGKDEVDEIWITFPDPYLRKKSKWSKRLTSSKFLNIYRKLLKTGGIIHLKTDSEVLFNYTLETIKQENGTIVKKSGNVHKEMPDDDLLSIRTYYEKMHLKEGKTIYYVAFRLA
jgi:tRNA (guanine-N7-)-methyltransferase